MPIRSLQKNEKFSDQQPCLLSTSQASAKDFQVLTLSKQQQPSPPFSKHDIDFVHPPFATLLSGLPCTASPLLLDYFHADAIATQTVCRKQTEY